MSRLVLSFRPEKVSGSSCRESSDSASNAPNKIPVPVHGARGANLIAEPGVELRVLVEDLIVPSLIFDLTARVLSVDKAGVSSSD